MRKNVRVELLEERLQLLILNTFSGQTKTFIPETVLPKLTFLHKCKFIYASQHDISKRLQITNFYEDEQCKELMKKRKKLNLKTLGTSTTELIEI